VVSPKLLFCLAYSGFPTRGGSIRLGQPEHALDDVAEDQLRADRGDPRDLELAEVEDQVARWLKILETAGLASLGFEIQ
jgi:hypothetical protein